MAESRTSAERVHDLTYEEERSSDDSDDDSDVLSFISDGSDQAYRGGRYQWKVDPASTAPAKHINLNAIHDRSLRLPSHVRMERVVQSLERRATEEKQYYASRRDATYRASAAPAKRPVAPRQRAASSSSVPPTSLSFPASPLAAPRPSARRATTAAATTRRRAP